jgi:ROK family protein (putative glucokinase)
MKNGYIGVDIGGMSVKAGIVTIDGKIIKKDRVPTDTSNGSEPFLASMKTLIVGLIKEANKLGYEIKGIGFGAPGVVNSEEGTIDYATNLKLYHVKVREYLKDLNIPIYISNDANVAALAEQRFGAAKGYHDAVMITLGTGVGSGIVINNKLFEGNLGKGAELGHMVIVVDGEECNCGRRGCFERYASTSALIRETQEVMQQNKESIMWNYCGYDINRVDGTTSFECAKAGDKAANQVIDTYIKYLGEGLLNVCNIFRPQAIILGGGVSAQKDYLKNKVQKYLEDHYYGYHETPRSEVVIAALTNDAGIIGAAILGFPEK